MPDAISLYNFGHSWPQTDQTDVLVEFKLTVVSAEPNLVVYSRNFRASSSVDHISYANQAVVLRVVVELAKLESLVTRKSRFGKHCTREVH